jgi:hypothetical protein
LTICVHYSWEMTSLINPRINNGYPIINMKITTLLDVTPCSLLQDYRRFEGMYRSKSQTNMQLAKVKQAELTLLLQNVDEFLIDYMV